LARVVARTQRRGFRPAIAITTSHTIDLAKARRLPACTRRSLRPCG
jgi:hypothetical protein